MDEWREGQGRGPQGRLPPRASSPMGEGPDGRGPRRERVWKGGGPNFALFVPSSATMFIFLPSLGGPLVEFWCCLKVLAKLCACPGVGLDIRDGQSGPSSDTIPPPHFCQRRPPPSFVGEWGEGGLFVAVAVGFLVFFCPAGCRRFSVFLQNT